MPSYYKKESSTSLSFSNLQNMGYAFISKKNSCSLLSFSNFQSMGYKAGVFGKKLLHVLVLII